MPTYQFKNTETGEITEKIMSISAMEEYKKENPHMQSYHSGAANIIGHTDGIMSKTSGDWRDLMKSIKKGSGRGDTIKTY